MQVERWTIPSGDAGRTEWLARRRNYINGSEIGALFAASPFITPYALYADKAGLAAPDDKDNKAMRRGRWQEPAVAEMMRDLHPDWTIEKCTDYFYSDGLGLGCTPDFWVTCPKRGRGILQCKNVAQRIFENEWGEELPLWIVLQTLLEQMLTGVAWGVTGVMVRTEFDDDPREFPFDRHADAEQRIIDSAAAFWADVKAGRQPKPDYAADGNVIRTIYNETDGSSIDLRRHNRISFLCEEKLAWNKRALAAEKALEVIDSEIIDVLGDAERGDHPTFNITRKSQWSGGGQPAPRKKIRVLRVTRKKTAQAAETEQQQQAA